MESRPLFARSMSRRKQKNFSGLWIAMILPWVVIGAASAQIPQGNLSIELTSIAEGLSSPVALTHAGDGSGRLFVADQTGLIRVIDNGALLGKPFLDLTDRIVQLNEAFDERGLLGLAFHPDYANNGRFFVRYSAPRMGTPEERCNDPNGFIVGCHKEVLSEFAVSGADPSIADPNSEVILFEIDEPQFNHNAGAVAFGPDGFLYFSLGDGGGAHDGLADTPPSHGPIGNGQNIETVLGALLRIDVDGTPPFEVPADNPFVGRTGADEIYAYGFRNPFRFSFDRLTDDLYLADVGQNLFEEINIVTPGGNYGWVIREGAHCFDPLNPDNPPAMCPTAGLIDPIAEYDHGDGVAVIGGFVYRGDRNPSLFGKYLFGDFSRDFGPTGRLFYLDADGNPSEIFEFADPASLGFFLKGIGQDEEGEVYALVSSELGPFGNGGQVLQIQELRDDNLLITEVVDGNLSGGRPKWVEITNCGENPIDLSDYSIGNFNNGGLNLGGGASTDLSGMLEGGGSYVFEYDADADSRFEEVYGFPSDQFAGGGFINGNDVVALFLGPATTDGNGNLDGLIVDAYGELGVDGAGEVWEYTDGFARRLPGSAPSVTFDPAEWSFGGVDSLDGGDEAADIVLLQTLTFPGQHDCAAGGTLLIRGDCDGNGELNGLVDSLLILGVQFQGLATPCFAACDADGDRVFNGLQDALLLLGCVFQQGTCPPAPFPECGPDENGIAALGCEIEPRACN